MQEIGKFRAERLFSNQTNMKWTLAPGDGFDRLVLGKYSKICEYPP